MIIITEKILRMNEKKYKKINDFELNQLRLSQIYR